MTGPGRVVVAGAGLAGPADRRGAAGPRVRRRRDAGRRGGPAALRPAAAVEEGDDRRAGRHLAARRPGVAGRRRPAGRDARPGCADGVLRDRRGRARVRRAGPGHRRQPGPAAGRRAASTCCGPSTTRWRCASCSTPGTSLAIVGAGWIGAELATAAAQPGLPGHGAGGGRRAAGRGRRRRGRRDDRRPGTPAAGVDLRLGQAVASIEPGGVALADGELAAGRRGRDGRRRPAGRGLAGRLRRPAGQRRGRGRAAADLGAGRVRGRRLRRRSGRAGTGGGCGSSTGTWRCTPPRWRPRTSWAGARPTTRCRTSGPSSSGGWCSTSGCHGGGRPAGLARAIRPRRSGRCAGWPATGWSRC